MPKNKTELYYFSFSSDVLIKSCPLPKEMIHSINTHTHTLTIEAVQSLSLSEYLKKTTKHIEYRDLEKMIQMIGLQLQHMERVDKGVASFNLDDISVFYTSAPKKVNTRTREDRNSTTSNTDDDTDDDTKTDDDTDANTHTDVIIHFAITNDDKVCDFENAQHLKITTPYKSEYTHASHTPTAHHHHQKNKAFISPEFKEFISKKTLPYSIHFKSGYYSFGLLCVYCFVSKTALIVPVTPVTPVVAPATKADITTTLDPIKNTKIYWFLMRVLHENPTARRYICS